MQINHVSCLLLALVAETHASRARQAVPASGAPTLPDRQPFGFGSAATGGGIATANNTFIVDNMSDLRTALKLMTPRTIYVKGEIDGTQINATTHADCQYYIDHSRVPGFNFTLYVMAMNETYMEAVKAADAAGEEFEGRNATEYLSLLKKQNVGNPLCSLKSPSSALGSPRIPGASSSSQVPT